MRSLPLRRAIGVVAAAAISVAAVGGHASAGEEGAVKVTPLFTGAATAAGQPILLPSGPVHVILSRYEIAPGAVLPVHRHPYQRYAYVEAGTLRVTNAETGEAATYHAGDVVVEMVDRWHSGANIGTDTVKLLVIDQVPPDKSNTILKDPD